MVVDMDEHLQSRSSSPMLGSPSTTWWGPRVTGSKSWCPFFDLSRIVVAAQGVGLAQAALDEPSATSQREGNKD